MASVIFDLDGTLADTSGDLLVAANAALGQLGHPAQLARGRDDGVAMRGGRAMLSLACARLGLSGDVAENTITRGYPILLAAYEAAIAEHTVLYPGALDAVETLRTDGYLIGICTNKPEALARKLMSELGAAEAFGALVGADTLPVRKPDPEPLFHTVRTLGGDPARAVMIGDTATDRDTARGANVPCILVDFGGDTDVVALQPEATIQRFDQLVAAVRRLLPPPG